MQNPLRRPTPGDDREDFAASLGGRIGAIYDRAEQVIVSAITNAARRVARGGLSSASARRAAALAADEALAAADQQAADVLDEGLAAAREHVQDLIGGQADREAAMQVPLPDGGAVRDALGQASSTARQSARDAAAKAISAAGGHGAPPGPLPPGTLGPDGTPSPHLDAVNRALAGNRGGLPGNSLSYSRLQAAEQALNELRDRGITGFVDRRGANWDLATYVEMATRTGVSQAWDDMQAAALVRAGLDLIKVYTDSTEGTCPLCKPWLGRILALTGATEGYPTLAEARAAGFRHPSCRCGWHAKDAGGINPPTSVIPLDQAAVVYEASQRQRGIERAVRAAGRVLATATTPMARTTARRRLAAARAVSVAHRQQTGLRMMQVTVKRREAPYGPR